MEIYGPRAAFKYLDIAFNHRLFAAQAQQIRRQETIGGIVKTRNRTQITTSSVVILIS